MTIQVPKPLLNIDKGYENLYTNENYPGYIPEHIKEDKIAEYKKLYEYICMDPFNIDNIIENETKYDEFNKSEPDDYTYISLLFENNNVSQTTSIENKNDHISEVASSILYNEDDDQDSINNEPILSNKSPISNTYDKDPKTMITQEITEESVNAIIKNQNKEIKRLNKELYTINKKSENINKFLEALNNFCPESLEKKTLIINYSRSINFPLSTYDLEMLNIDEIDNIYNMINNIKRYKSSFNFSSLVIKLSFILVEKLLVEYLKIDIFKDISKDINDEFINSKCSSTKNFINTYAKIPEYPFIDIAIQIFTRALEKQIGLNNILSN
ncbi:virion membrane formation [Alphaentomopoxvirus acuprea]|uniref:Virion membrane formation n=1 Tax=Alphaentomopoxvirus acuprea TaxID=62099 RepID=W6JIW4_9POXV|nr:virion membrane formation [Anomala cuprea entomopoxvirus]BAO49502.1 virion membrane formation [Anomala cuprea entomopoxvirus]